MNKLLFIKTTTNTDVYLNINHIINIQHSINKTTIIKTIDSYSIETNEPLEIVVERYNKLLK